MKQQFRFYLIAALFFILAGLLLSSPHFIRQWKSKSVKPAFNTSQEHAATRPATVSGTPTHIDIPSVDISVDIEPGYYNKQHQTWTLSTTKAEYATITPTANNGGGNTFVYGHNRWAVFYKLLKVQPGDTAIVTTANNHTFTYKMTGQKVTQPTDSSLFRYQGPPILTLQTCSGLWYQNRSLFIFNLEKVS
jgi:LPXTG-site transpeptidase (sortase) family protein